MSDRSDYEALVQRILESNANVDGEFDKVGDVAQTACDINGIADQLNISVVRNNGGKVIGYDMPYTYPREPNLPLMDADSNTDHGIFGYATGGGGFTRGGGAGRFAGSYYDKISKSTLGTVDESGNKSFVSGLISSAWAGVSALSKLGKQVGSQAANVMEALGADYELNFGPLCVSGDTEGVANAIRVLFGVDDQGNTTMYMDQDTIGALAIQARDNGLFRGGYDIDDYSSESGIYPTTLNFFRNNFPGGAIVYKVSKIRGHFFRYWDGFQYWYGVDFSKPVYVLVSYRDYDDYYGKPHWYLDLVCCSFEAFESRTETHYSINATLEELEEILSHKQFSPAHYNVFNDVEYYYKMHTGNVPARELASTPDLCVNHATQQPNTPIGYEEQVAYIVLTRSTGEEPIPGIDDQPGATIPVDAITGADPHVVGQNLYDQYPAVMGMPITITTMDDSCNEVHQNYFSVPISFGYQDGLDVNVDANVPITGVGQLNPSFNPDISIDPSIDLSKYMEQVINQLSGSGAGRDIVRTDPSTGLPTVLPTVPPSTGTGVTPPPVLPETGVVGMWHVYNPTSYTVSALGSWLWSANIIDQIVRLFTNPMEAIIGLHAVYAEPTVSGAQPIVVGNLTANVSAPVVTKQYATVDCGTVWLTEYFGNVFDYEPFTKVSLFLPFIGIVDLNVADVMRASISVTYNIDMYTGACIAMVNVSRDGVGGVLYEFSGCCAIQYPISASNYSSMLQGIISAGLAGVGSAMATGGNPVMVGAAAEAAFMSTASISVRRSGSFAGNPGAMGPKRPYLIITRPQTNMAINFDSYDGRGSNYTSRIGDNVGYVKCKEVHLNVPGAFANELAEIESLLKSGVMLKDYAVSKSIEPGPEPAPVSRLMVTENGTYTASGTLVGYNPVIVDVPGPVLEELTATANGVYTPTGDGYSQVTVNVSGGGGGVLTGTTPPAAAIGLDGDFYVQTFTEGVLTSDGACYIDTGIRPNALYAVEIVAALTQQTTNYDTLFGTRNGSAARFTARFGSESNGALDVHKSPTPTSNYVTWSTGQTKSTMLNTYVRLYLKDMLRVNEVFRNGATTTNVNTFPYSIFLFANNNVGSVSDYACCAIKSFKVWDNNGELIMYLMPASDNGVACMYDLVTGQYFQNSGTGTFTYTDSATTFDAILWKKVSGAWTIVSNWG